MKKSIYKILVIMLILVSTIVFLPSCKEKPEEPEIMPYGVYYFVSYDYSDGIANWYITPNTKKRIDIINKAMEYYGYYFVFTPDKIIFGGSLQSQTEYEFEYSLAVGPGIYYDGSLKLNYDNFNDDSKQYLTSRFNFYYNKTYNKTYEFNMHTIGDNLKLLYAYFPNNVPPYILDGTPYGDTEILKRAPINYKDYI